MVTNGRLRGAARALPAAAMIALLAGAVPVGAQVATAPPVPTASPTAPASPAPEPTLLPEPAVPVIVLPSATPAPVRARPRAVASPTPRATPSPTPRASLSPVTPAPTPAAMASAASTEAAPTAVPVPVVPAPPAVGAPVQGEAAGYWPLALGAALVAALALGWVLLRRRHKRGAGVAAAQPEPPQLTVPVSAPQPAPRARLAIAFRPLRAGLNLLSATSENEIVVTNIGDAPAEDIRLVTRLVSAHAGQGTELATIYAQPIARPAVPAFALQPGEQRVVTSIAALPRDAIRTLTAAGRSMFVPIVAVNLHYATGGDDRQLAQAFAVGVERVDSAKLAPFWLDVPPRTFDQVAARPHAAALER